MGPHLDCLNVSTLGYLNFNLTLGPEIRTLAGVGAEARSLVRLPNVTAMNMTSMERKASKDSETMVLADVGSIPHLYGKSKDGRGSGSPWNLKEKVFWKPSSGPKASNDCESDFPREWRVFVSKELRV